MSKIEIFTIEYDGIQSCDFGLQLATVSDNSFEAESGVDPETISFESPRYEGKIIYGVKQSEGFEFPITLISETVIDLDRMIQIKDWLFHHNKPCKFRFIGDRYSDWFYYAFMSYECDYIDGEGIKGIKIKVKSISPYAYGDVISQTFDLSDQLTTGEETDKNGEKTNITGFANTATITVPNVQTANVYGVKPIIKIKCSVPNETSFNNQRKINSPNHKEGEGIVFNYVYNLTTDESTWFSIPDVSAYGTRDFPTEIVVDCHNGLITANGGNSDTGKTEQKDFYGYFYWGMSGGIYNDAKNPVSTFPALVKGDNKLRIYGFIQSITIEYIPSVRLGAW